MVVLENESVTPARKVDQGCSSRKTHRHAEGELMRRSDINYFRRTLFRWPRNGDSLPVNRLWNDSRAGEAKGSASLIKSRIFDPRDVSPIYERHRTDHHCLLRSSGDDDLVRMTAGTSVITQISCERFAKVGVATA